MWHTSEIIVLDNELLCTKAMTQDSRTPGFSRDSAIVKREFGIRRDRMRQNHISQEGLEAPKRGKIQLSRRFGCSDNLPAAGSRYKQT